jgi:hypothetical protein
MAQTGGNIFPITVYDDSCMNIHLTLMTVQCRGRSSLEIKSCGSICIRYFRDY